MQACVKNLVTFWETNPKLWFTKPGTLDQILIDQFFYYHYRDLVEQVYRDKNRDTKYQQENQFLRILCLDQISRHINRHLCRRGESYPLELYLDQAYEEARVCVLPKTMPLGQTLWILLCIRHRNTYDDLTDVVRWIEKNYSRTIHAVDPHHSFFLKFMRKTFELYEKYPLRLPPVVNDEVDINLAEFNTILQPTDSKQTLGSPENVTSVKKIRLEIMKLARRYKTIIVSLSGGVDSMVILDCLTRLRIELPSLNIIAVHICYLNREAAKREAEFLNRWCASKRIVLVTRTIFEYTREAMNRELYESKTREIRFATYQRVIRSLDEPPENVPIVLGHHSGDVRENVITNVLNGHSMLELGKMKKLSIHHNLLFSRPLLSLDKDHVYRYSNQFKIPYFLDTTPSWSCRGVLRNELLPTMYRQWGEHKVKTNLDHIGKMSEQWNSIIRTHILQPFLDKVKYTARGWSFEIPDFNETVFWFEVWGTMCRRFGDHGIPQPSKKSIINFTHQLRTKRKMKVVLNKQITAIIGKNISVLVDVSIY